ncbi:hypothetical protein M9Y10_014862 [Tritrichomonas musculus]|uniref:Uncharacterized protein n=1 Tax=Tritrichomonas musculus TaxID=1915356 RepID=A0ABR2L0N4_9EUKA
MNNQSIQEYINDKKEIYDLVTAYLENLEDDDDFLQVNDIIKRYKYEDDPEEFKEFFQILNFISINHYFNVTFFKRIEKLLNQYALYITKNFKNSGLFNIFKNNKRILQFLIEKKIFQFDEYIINEIKYSNDPETKSIYYFFFPEIKRFKEIIGEIRIKNIENEIISQDSSNFNNFDLKRKEGQNDSYICCLIRQDLIENFVSFVNRTNYHLTSEVKPSIFETNLFLKESNPTLIEYAAFYNSIQIFQYLLYNKVELEPSLWLYAIHGHSLNVIHLLEYNKVSPPKGNYVECLIEAIKCHHNDIASYIENNLIATDEIYKNIEIKERLLSNILQFHNYSYFPSNFTNDNEFFYLCNHNYTKIVSIFLSNKEKEVKNNTIVNLYCKLLKTNAAHLFYLKEKDVISKIAIPPSIKRIEFSAFSKFSSLKQISIPSSVIYIGDYAFNKCVLLEQISIPFSITSIKEATFNCCYKLSQISIPPSVITIEKDAFYNCQSLKQVSIPSSVTSIGNYAFSSCISLKQIFIPSSVLSIGNYAFNYCFSLTNIIFEKPSSVIFGIGTFSECYSLQQISIPSSVTSIESKLFYFCKSLKQISFDNPSSIKSINDSAFNYCISIDHVEIPDSVNSIGIASFFNCSSLTDILIPSSVVSIGESAFENCTSLAHVSLPSSVKTIENYAFGNCDLLDRSDIPSCFNETIYESHNDYI